MANKKISELQSRTPALSDLMLVGDPSSGYSYKCTVTALATIIETDIADGFVTIGTTQTVSGAKTFSNNLTLTSVANTPTDPDKFLTLNASNIVTYRTGAEVLSDIGGASSSSISGTTNYVAKFTSSSAVGNSTIQDSGSLVTIGSNTTISLNAPELTLNQGTSSASLINFKENNVLINRITSSGATLSFTTNNSGTPSIVLSSGGTTTFGTIPNATIDTDRFLVSDGGVLKYRTGSEVLSDIGGQSALTNPVTGTGTTNYVTKWTSSSAVGNSQIIDNGTAIGIGTAPSNAYILSVAGIYRGVGVGNASRIELYDTQSGGATFFISPQESLGVTSLGTYGAFPILFITNATERIRIASAGDVTISTIANATVDTDKFLVSDSGVIKYRTGSELLSDIGGASSSSISGTTNYIPKFTSSSAIGNSVLYESGGDIGVGTTSLGGKFQVKIDTDLNIAFNSTDGVARISAFNDAISASIPLIINADDLRFSTGGSERLRISSTGNVGIGTSVPEELLELSSSNTTGGQLLIESTGSSSGNYAGMRFKIAGGTNGGYEKAGIFALRGSGGYNDLSLIFATNTVADATNVTSANEKMRLDASGNLGLGVTPSAWNTGYKAMQITSWSSIASDNTYNGATEILTNAYIGTASSSNYIYTNNGASTRYKQVDGTHSWSTAASGTAGNAISFTQAMTLDASGNLGIGSTSPSSYYSKKLVVSVGDEDGITIAGVNDNYLMFADGTTGDDRFRGFIQYSHTSDYMALATNASERMRITSGGNVGIGSSSPTTKLQVEDGYISTYHNINANSAGYGIQFFTNGGGSKNTIGAIDISQVGTARSGDLLFSTSNAGAPSERMRITSGGELLINTTTDAGDYKLQVNGAGYFIYTGGVPSINLRASDTNFALMSILGNQTGDVNWLLMSGYPNAGDFTIRQSDVINALTIAKTTGNAIFSGSIKTAAPSGGTAKPWKLGEAGVTLGGSNTSGVRVEIDGTVYYLVTGYLP